MDIILLGDKVLIEPLEESVQNQSGIFIPQTDGKKLHDTGIVVSVGECKDVKVGDKIIFDKYGPSEVQLEGKRYLVAREDMILGIIK